MWRHTNVAVTGHAKSSSSLGCSTQRPVSASKPSRFAPSRAAAAGNNNLVLNNGASSVIAEANQGPVTGQQFSDGWHAALQP
jgi:hypothetical protein